MSELVPSLVSLDKGLNLQTAKLVAPPGSVLDTLNYEQVDFQGQKRIDGFVRYDGQFGSAFDDYYKITLATPLGVTGEQLLWTTSPFAKLVSNGQSAASTTVIYVSIIDQNLIPSVGDTIYYDVNGVPTGGSVISAISKGVNDGSSVDVHYANL